MRKWQYWLKKTAKFYNITQKEVLADRSKTNLRPKSTFYWLLFHDRHDLYKVSIAIGKERSTVAKFIDRSLKKVPNKYRDKSAEEYLLNKFQ